MVSREDITRFNLDMDGSMEPAEHGRWVRHEDLVRAIAAERNKLAAWMIERGYATGHDTKCRSFSFKSCTFAW